MPETTIMVPAPYGGISHQPIQTAHPNQVRDAQNVTFSVPRSGGSKRAGSVYDRIITSLVATKNYRMFPIVRDELEQYLIIYGGGDETPDAMAVSTVLRIFDLLNGDEATVTISAAAQSYLDASNASADNLKLLHSADTTILTNTKVQAQAKRSTDYVNSMTFENYDRMIQHTPEQVLSPTTVNNGLDTYHRAESDTVVHPAGYWQYVAGDGNAAFPYNNFDPARESWLDPSSAGRWYHGHENPMGFRTAFIEYDLSELGTFTTAAVGGHVSLSLTSGAKAFEFYEHKEGDEVYITSGTGMAHTSWWKIMKRVSDTHVHLVGNPGTATDVVIAGIGTGDLQVSHDFSGINESSMLPITQAWEKEFDDLGHPDVLISFNKTGPKTGAFQMTGPYRGLGARILYIEPPLNVGSGTNQIQDIRNRSGAPFYNDTFHPQDGTGASSTSQLDPIERWVNVAAPNQKDATLDANTLPIKIVRKTTHTTDADFIKEVLADSPAMGWMFDETDGGRENPAADVTGNTANDLEYTAESAKSQTVKMAYGGQSLRLETSSTFGDSSATYPAGVSTGVGGAALTTGFTIEFVLKSASAVDVLVAYFRSTGSPISQLQVKINSDGKVLATYASNGMIGGYHTQSLGTTDIIDNAWHHVACVYKPGSDIIDIYIDGSASTDRASTTAGSSGHASAWTGDVSEFGYIRVLRNVNSSALSSNMLLDALVLYESQLSTTRITAHDTAMDTVLTGSPATFDVDVIDWKDRYSGDNGTNPAASIFSNAHRISGIQFHRNRLALGGAENVVMSQAGDFFNFYKHDANNLVDSDPIDVALGSDQVTIIDDIVSFRKSLSIFTKAGRQFELNAPEALTPATAAITATTAYETLSVTPVTRGNMLYFVAKNKGYGALYEYFYDESQVQNVAAEISAHAYRLLPTTIKSLVSSTNNNVIMILPESSNKIHVYRLFWNGNTKEMSAWSTSTFDSTYKIADLSIVENDCWILVDDGTQFTLEKLALEHDVAKTNWPYVIHLDRQLELTGSFSTNTTWTIPFTDATIDTIILGPDFSSPGTVVTVTSSGTTVTAAGANYTAGEVTLGRSYTKTLELNQPFRRNVNNVPVADARLDVKRILTLHDQTFDYRIRRNWANRTDVSKTFTSTTADDGDLLSLLGGNVGGPGPASNMATFFIENTTPKPSTITGIEYTVDYEPRRSEP